MIPQIPEAAGLLLENLPLISRESRFYTGKSKKKAISMRITDLTDCCPVRAYGAVFRILPREARKGSPPDFNFCSKRTVQSQSPHAQGSLPFSSRHFRRS